MTKQYITIKEAATVEVIEKKSRFIAHVLPVQTIEEVEEALTRIRKEHHNASHNCFAYQMGERNELQRCSDDGEPQGTAGKPILDVLKGQDIKNTLIVVTRYFGGTLLGTGGLVRAYGKAAKEGILTAGLVTRVRIRLIALEMSYSLSGKVQYLLNEKGYPIRDTEYTEVVRFVVEVVATEEDDFEKWMIENSNAEVSLKKGEYEWIDRPIT